MEGAKVSVNQTLTKRQMAVRVIKGTMMAPIHKGKTSPKKHFVTSVRVQIMEVHIQEMRFRTIFRKSKKKGTSFVIIKMPQWDQSIPISLFSTRPS